jgi:hypothetical protein
MLLLLRSLLEGDSVDPPEEPPQGGQQIGNWHFGPSKSLDQVRQDRRRRDEEIVFLSGHFLP